MTYTRYIAYATYTRYDAYASDDNRNDYINDGNDDDDDDDGVIFVAEYNVKAREHSYYKSL